MNERAVTILAWVIIVAALIGQVFAQLDNGFDADLGPLAIIAAGFLFGRRVVNGGRPPVEQDSQ